MRLMLLAFGFLSTGLILPGFGLDRPEVPASAKKLDAFGIADLYQGRRAAFNNLTHDVSLTGEIFYDLKGKVMFGTYISNKKNKGLFTGKIWVKADKFCNKPDKGKKECLDVFLDGKTYYEVGADGRVTSVDTILDMPPALPATAKKVKPDEFIAASTGKRVFATIFDYDEPAVADLVWDWKKKRVTGKFIYAGTKQGKVDTKITVEGDTVCGINKGEKTKNCYTYYLDAGGFYEMTSDGKLHAWSTFE